MDRFKNGCVLEFKITTSNIQVKLVYDGIVDEEKPDYVYYVSPNSAEDPKVAAGKYKTTLFKEINIPNTIYDVSTGVTYVFYLIRHGQGEHNVLKGMSKKWGALAVSSTYKDPSLTNTGVQQATEIGQKLQQILDEQHQKVDYLFASDLQRTRQTLHYITQVLDADDELLIKDIIILPCSHELEYTAGKNCDANQSYITPNENISLCNPFAKEEDPSCQLKHGRNTTHWRYYTTFYGTGTRRPTESLYTKFKMKGHRNPPQKCQNTDMIKQAIIYIENNIQRNQNAYDRNYSSLNTDGNYESEPENAFDPENVPDPKCSKFFYRMWNRSKCKGYNKVAAASGGTKRRRGKFARTRKYRRQRGKNKKQTTIKRRRLHPSRTRRRQRR
jgi:bisphosphoglycerate-dependent phosphoglycerate mutase